MKFATGNMHTKRFVFEWPIFKHGRFKKLFYTFHIPQKLTVMKPLIVTLLLLALICSAGYAQKKYQTRKQRDLLHLTLFRFSTLIFFNPTILYLILTTVNHWRTLNGRPNSILNDDIIKKIRCSFSTYIT